MQNCVITTVVNNTCKKYRRYHADTRQKISAITTPLEKNISDTNIATFTDTYQYCNL